MFCANRFPPHPRPLSALRRGEPGLDNKSAKSQLLASAVDTVGAFKKLTVPYTPSPPGVERGTGGEAINGSR